MKKIYITPSVEFEFIEYSSPLMGSKDFETKPESNNGGDGQGSGTGMDYGGEGSGTDINDAKGGSTFIWDDEF